MSNNKAFIKENEWLRSLALEDQKAFAHIYKDSFDVVTRSLMNMNAQADEAESIFHASLLVLFEKSKDDQFTLDCKISTFLVAVSRNKWLKQLEKEKRLTQKEADYAQLHFDPQANNHFDSKQLQEDEQLRIKLLNALKILGEPCSSLLKAFYIDNKRMKEIAIQLNYSDANTAKTQKHKCLQRLKKIFFAQ